MLRAVFFISLALVSTGFTISRAAAAERELIIPFKASGVNHAYDVAPIADFVCPASPKAVRVLEFDSIYTDKTDGASIVDPAAEAKYRADTSAIRDFENTLMVWTGIYMSNPEQNLAYAECAADWLYTWAEGEALLGKANPQGRAVQKWTLAALSSLFIQMAEDDRISGQKVRLVKAWLNLVAQNVRNYYSKSPELTTRQNNHMYWASWAVMITGVLLDDHDMFQWALGQYKFGADQIQEDGTLPHEMARMGKAFNYHVFAAAPLVMMAETAARNNIDLYAYNNGALKRLVDRILTELETDQKYIAEKTDREQNLDGTVTPGQLAWMEPYYARFKEPRMERWIKSMRPMEQRRMGGNLTLLFSKE
jgi:poly(beta-D-mannuronate) lyase